MEAISENAARQYLNEADDKLKQLHEFCAFRDRLYEIVFGLKSLNVRDELIILTIQDEFGFDEDDAEFYFDYIVKTKNIL